tara:strand:+ start:1335 stop:1799 length:465 start_codon:yes stop_codon:yes gene_type:complete
MKNFIYIFIIFLFITNCTLNKVVKHHGVHNLEKKNNKIIVMQMNTNDVIKLIGTPSTKSTFDNDLWIYLERKKTASKVTSLGREKMLSNNVLVLEFDKKGILVKKDFLVMKDMNKLKLSKNKTAVINKKDTFISTFMSSLRQKINDPLGVKGAK